MTRTATCKTIALTIYIAGDYHVAKQVCREFCMSGLCITIDQTTYIYTGGEEAGVKIGLLNYPRFPSNLENLTQTALRLAELLKERLCQNSYSVITPDETFWFSTRK